MLLNKQVKDCIDFCSILNRPSVLGKKSECRNKKWELIKSSETPWRRQWHPTPVFLPRKSHGWRSLVGCSPLSCEELDTTEWLHIHFHALEKEMATHSSVLAWRIPGMGQPSGLPSMGLHRVGHDWSNLAAAAAAVRHLKFRDLCYGASPGVLWLRIQSTCQSKEHRFNSWSQRFHLLWSN